MAPYRNIIALQGNVGSQKAKPGGTPSGRFVAHTFAPNFPREFRDDLKEWLAKL